MKFPIIVTALLLATITESVIGQHFSCQGKGVTVPTISVAEKKCAGVKEKMCRVHCIFREASLLDEDNHVDLEGFIEFYPLFPSKEANEKLSDQMIGCVDVADKMPKKLDSVCSQFKPYLDCMKEGFIKSKICSTNHEIFD